MRRGFGSRRSSFGSRSRFSSIGGRPFGYSSFGVRRPFGLRRRSFGSFGRYGRASAGPMGWFGVAYFLVFFLFVFFMTIVPIFFGDWLFEVGFFEWFPFIFIGLFLFMFIFVISGVISSARQAPQMMAQMGQMSSFQALEEKAKALGFTIEEVPENDPSEADVVLKHPRMNLLVRFASDNEAFPTTAIQKLSGGLSAYSAKEAWVIKGVGTFPESDHSMARFYNVKLLNATEAIQNLENNLK